jgi:hypothetical protein
MLKRMFSWFCMDALPVWDISPEAYRDRLYRNALLGI